MFTGIIQSVGSIETIDRRDNGDARLRIVSGGLDLSGASLGDSISVSGCCLTAVALESGAFIADVSNETLACTTLGERAEGDPVNLEPALRIGDPLGGHLVSGHVDDVGEVLAIEADARSSRFRFRAPAALARYIARKGSICIDGVSLTVNEVDAREFGVNIIPHTMAHTVFGSYAPGTRVNLEVDQIARYTERLLADRTLPQHD